MMTYGTVARETRFLIGLTIAVIAPFGFLLYLFPSSAGDYWAWEIAQPRTAMLVGSIYFATSIYYVLLSRQREWLLLQSSLRSLFVVAVWLLVAAMFHWQSFFPYRLMTLIWLITYYLPLMSFPILNRLQAERGGNAEKPAGRQIIRGWRTWLILRAAIYGPTAILLFVFAPQVSAAWPWPIEPVNLRMFSGQIAVFGAYQALAMQDGFWQRIRLFMLCTAMLATAHLVGLLLSGTPYDSSAPVGALLPLMFVEWLATGLGMLWTHRK
ncbi:MAG TPA: hypothetical protein VI410_09895 [Anaerolineales bacterium]|nr:hypothetical protein [Anaerolineales bacterium]